ncbi:acyltransferase [Mariniblastus sp.]|nr:acyltransferase [Mariniblastus sp.]
MAGIGYRPEIDGLRALAVVAVVMFHLGLGLPGGFVGVDVFFVISGFLITGIIRRGLENDTFSLAVFWERRVRRIFPAIFVVVMATLVAGYWLLLPNELEELGKSSVAQALLLANVYFWRDTGYFAGPAELKPLLHTWSLAVEEQFYLFFPLALCCLRRLSSTGLFALLTTVGLISFAGSVYGTMFYPDPTFYLLPTRAWELLIGCMLAVFPWKFESSPRRDSAIATLGLLAIALPIFLYDSKTPFPGLAAAPPVLGTATIMFATGNTPKIWLCKVLSLRPVVFIGLISYSLYLWHWPVIVFMRTYYGDLGWVQILVCFVMSFVLAVLSWRFVETPFRRTTYLSRRRILFATAGILSFLPTIAGIVFVATDGLPLRLSNYSPVQYQDTVWRGQEYMLGDGGRTFRENLIPSIGTKNLSSPKDRLSLVVWGDSHGMMLCGVIDKICKKHGLNGKAINSHGVPPLPNVRNINKPRRGNNLKDEIFTWLDEKRPKTICLIGAWASYYFVGENQLSDGQPYTSGAKAQNQRSKNLEILRRNLDILVKFCDNRDIKLVLINQVPVSGELTPARDLFLFTMGQRDNLSDKRTTSTEHNNRMSDFNTILSTYSPEELRTCDPSPYFFDDDGLQINYRNGRSYFRDSGHLTEWGAQLIEPVLESILLETTLED